MPPGYASILKNNQGAVVSPETLMHFLAGLVSQGGSCRLGRRSRKAVEWKRC